MRGFMAVLAGMVTGFVCIMGLEAVSHAIYPPPPGLDFSKPEVIAELMKNAPTGALLLVALAHFFAGIFGNMVTLLIAQRKRLPGYIFSLLLLAGTVANLVMIPHPMWFAVVDVAGVVIAVVLIFRLIKSPAKK